MTTPQPKQLFEWFDIKPFDAQIGDRLLGLPDYIVASVHYQATAQLDGATVPSELVYGTAGAWRIEFTNGRTLTYAATRKITVGRPVANT